VTSAGQIRVRGASRADAHAVWVINSCPGVIRGTLRLPYESLDEVERRFADQPPQLRRLVAEVDGRVVGLLGLEVGRGRRAHSAAIGMMVHDDFQGRGVGTALLAAAIELAEGWLGLHRLELEVYTDNAAALRLYRKFGFEEEGRLRRFALRDGQWADAIYMARLAPIGRPT
jgi:putative acetyltransferase